MNFKQWNLRGLSFFQEEIKDIKFPSIKNFQQKDYYDPNIRMKLYQYLQNCPEILATTYHRLHAYKIEEVSLLVYSTDGEFIFTNTLKDYLLYDDFVLPQKWYELIKFRDFRNPKLVLDHQKITSGKMDIFKNFERSFDEKSIVEDFIR